MELFLRGKFHPVWPELMTDASRFQYDLSDRWSHAYLGVLAAIYNDKFHWSIP